MWRAVGVLSPLLMAACGGGLIKAGGYGRRPSIGDVFSKWNDGFTALSDFAMSTPGRFAFLSAALFISETYLSYRLGKLEKNLHEAEKLRTEQSESVEKLSELDIQQKRNKAALSLSGWKTLRTLTRGSIVTLGLGILGVDIAGMIDGLGLATMGLSFALREVLSNFVFSIILKTNGLYVVGDEVEVADSAGGSIRGVITNLNRFQDVVLSGANKQGETVTFRIAPSELYSKTVKIYKRDLGLINSVNVNDYVKVGEITGKVIDKTDMVLMLGNVKGAAHSLVVPVHLSDLHVGNTTLYGSKLPPLGEGAGAIDIGDEIILVRRERTIQGKVVSFDTQKITLALANGSIHTMQIDDLWREGGVTKVVGNQATLIANDQAFANGLQSELTNWQRGSRVNEYNPRSHPHTAVTEK